MEAFKSVASEKNESPELSNEWVIEILGWMTSGDNSPEREQQVLLWINDLTIKGRDSAYHPYDYLLLSYLYRFDCTWCKHMRQTIYQHMVSHWQGLLPGKNVPESFPHRLPNSYLKKSERKFRAFHSAVFLPDPLSRKYDLSDCFRDVVIETKDVVLILSILLLCIHPVGLQITVGFLVGLLGFASFNEMLTHRHVGHHEELEQRFFDKTGRLGRSLEYVSLAHKLHHVKVKIDFNVSFMCATYREKIEQVAKDELRKLVSKSNWANDKTTADELLDVFINAGYGVNATPLGSTYMLLAAIPGYIILIALAYFFNWHVFAVSSVIFGTFFILQSLHSHRYLHMNKQEINSGIHQTTSFMRWYMTTRIAQFQQRLHFVHHQYSMYQKYNDVIMMCSGGDWLLKKVKAPNCLDLMKMEKQKFLDYQ